MTIRWENISPTRTHNFRQQIEDGDDIDTYDYAIDHALPAAAFSINGLPTIVPEGAASRSASAIN